MEISSFFLISNFYYLLPQGESISMVVILPPFEDDAIKETVRRMTPQTIQVRSPVPQDRFSLKVNHLSMELFYLTGCDGRDQVWILQDRRPDHSGASQIPHRAVDGVVRHDCIPGSLLPVRGKWGPHWVPRGGTRERNSSYSELCQVNSHF